MGSVSDDEASSIDAAPPSILPRILHCLGLVAHVALSYAAVPLTRGVAMTARDPQLWIPGPTRVDEEVAAAAMRPMIGHRGPEISELLERTLPRIQSLLQTKSSVYPLGCSATGAMEAAVRNAAPGPFLHLVCGAFSARWSQIREACGLPGDELVVEWGEPISGDALAQALEEKRYAAVTLVHNETSTGVLNPLPELASIVRQHADTLLLVDTVSSMAAVELALDEWGVDVCLAGTQKAWALPPGLTICAVNERARRRSADAPAKGYYLDWMQHEKSLAKRQTPSTPPISLLFQLDAALDRIDREGLGARYERHAAMQRRAVEWALDRGFELFAREGYRSRTVTAVEVGDFDVVAFRDGLRERGITMGGGYGKTKEHVFRIGHMGEWSLDDLNQMLTRADAQLEAMSHA